MKLIYHVLGYIKLLTTMLSFLFAILSFGSVIILSTSGTWTMDNVIQWDDFWNYTRPLPMFLLFFLITVSTHYVLIPMEKHLKIEQR